MSVHLLMHVVLFVNGFVFDVWQREKEVIRTGSDIEADDVCNDVGETPPATCSVFRVVSCFFERKLLCYCYFCEVCSCWTGAGATGGRGSEPVATPSMANKLNLTGHWSTIWKRNVGLKQR